MGALGARAFGLFMADAAGSHQRPFEGRVDSVSDGVLRGWAWFPGAPDEAATIELIVNGEVIATARADRTRADLEAAQKRGGACAFEIALPPLAAERSVSVRLADGRDLDGSPVTDAGAALEVQGQVDFINGHEVRGWCWHPQRPDLRATIVVRAGAAIVATTRADIFRQDLADAGKGDGAHGFHLVLPPLWETRARSLNVELADGRSLPGGACSLQPLPKDESEPDGPWPLRFIGAEGYLECFGPRIRGWATPAPNGPTTKLRVCEGDNELFVIDAKLWRTDLEDGHQGDGRGGFDLSVPAFLCDGQTRAIDIRLGAQSLLYEPLQVTLDASIAEPAAAPPVPPTLSEQITALVADATAALAPVHFSFIVNFYNMQREAERTLTSLTRAYQRDAEHIRYEVICIDNGSNPPMDEAWVQSFGPEFRLVRPSKILPSPCFAINEAARQARGRHVAIVVDGAHILSPGVFREAKAAADENADTVVAIRHWFIGGDQRWLKAVGYTREQEDILFARARWPENGYNLFAIGVPMSENPNHWFDPIAESNCLFVPKDFWAELGGMDERFEIPGGGFCNLDLLRRASAAKGGVVVLVGEATFHQYHEGTTTNVPDEEKDARVRSYAAAYRSMRGEEFANLSNTQFRVRGRFHGDDSYGTRQRPAFNAPLGVTTKVRPGPVERWIDVGSIRFLNGAYVESGLHQLTTWRGEKVGLAPGDLLALQDILHAVRPERIVLTQAEAPLIHFLDDICRVLDLGESRIVCLCDEQQAPHPRVDFIIGSTTAPETLAAIAAKLGAAENTLVLYAPREDEFFPIDQLRALAQFVSFGSYLVVLRTTLGQPWLGYSKYWLQRVIKLFVESSDFVIDDTRTQHVVSVCSGGYLARVMPPTPRNDDDALDSVAS